MTVKEYDELQEYGEQLIKNNKLPLSPYDLINEAYLETAGSSPDVPSVKKAMVRYALREKQQLRRTCQLLDTPLQPAIKEDTRVCSCCNEILPVSIFRLHKDGDPRYVCIPCDNRRRKASRQGVSLKTFDKVHQIADSPEMAKRMLQLKQIHASVFSH